MYELYPVTVFVYRLRDTIVDPDDTYSFSLKYSAHKDSFMLMDARTARVTDNYFSVNQSIIDKLYDFREAITIANFNSPEEALEYMNNLLMMV